MEYVNTAVAVHTYTQTYCLDWTLLTVFTAPCCLELLCFSSWRSRARFVFIVTSFSASWLSSVIKVFSQLFQRLQIHCLLVCVSCLCVCVCVSELSLKCFNGEDDITVYSDHCSRLPLKAVFYTYSRHERAAPLAELNTSDMSSFFWDTSKFPQLSHHLWVLGSSTLPFKPSVARDTLKGENKWVMYSF